MASNKLYYVEKNTEDVIKTLLTNTIKMLTERGLLDPSKIDDNIQSIINDQQPDRSYVIKLISGKLFAVRIIPHKITAVNKTYGLLDFLVGYKKNPKIIILKEISNKAYQQIIKNYPETEVFYEHELMINLVDHVLVPKHIPLKFDDVDKEFYEPRNLKRRQMPRMLASEPVARYYNLKPEDICRIIRPSEKSGEYPTYRRVIKGTLPV